MTTDEEVEWLRSAYEASEAAPRSGFPDLLFDVAEAWVKEGHDAMVERIAAARR
jgi:hypothetical protein